MEKDIKQDLEISHPLLVYSFLVLFVIFSTSVLHASRKGVKISKYLKRF
jgi:hypothetical protein